MKLSFLQFISLLLFFCLTRIISAQWVSNPAENNAISVFSENQIEVELCNDQAGGVFVFWRDYRDETGIFGGDIYGQHLDSSGTIQWEENGRKIQSTTNGEFRPHVIPDGEGGVILLWSQNQGFFYNYRLFCQRLDSAGNKLWGADGITIASLNGTNSFPQIAPDTKGGVYIVWENSPGTPGETDIYLQHVDSSGSAYWPANGLLLCDAADNQSFPVICPDEQGGVYIAWQDDRDSVALDLDIYGQHIDSAKTVLWEDNGLALCQTESFVEFPVIVNKGTEGAFIAWEDYRNDNADIGLQYVTSGGELLLGEQGTLICTAAGQQTNISMAANKVHGLYIFWEDGRNDDYDIYGQYMDQDALPQWTANGLAINSSANHQISPAVQLDNYGNCFIAWQDNRDDEWGDIYGQMMNPGGEFLWPSEGVALATASGLEQAEPVVEAISDGNFVTSWQDRRNETDYDIYLQKVNRDEHSVPIYIENRKEKLNFYYELVQNFPNPFNSSTLIRYTLSQKSKIELTIYNLLGEKIATLINGVQPGGQYQVRWQADNLSSGIYLCCLHIDKQVIVKRMIYLK
jgi:hypothetical protein